MESSLEETRWSMSEIIPPRSASARSEVMVSKSSMIRFRFWNVVLAFGIRVTAA